MNRIKLIDGYSDAYITIDGRVLSTNKKRIWIKQRLQNGGYPIVDIQRGSNKRTLTVHRLVALSYIDNPELKKEVNHIDGNKENNNVSNLEWVTRRENQRHAIETGLFVPKFEHLSKYRGQKHSKNTRLKLSNKKIKITFSDAKEIRELVLNKKMSYKEIRCKFLVSNSTIAFCKNNSFKCYDLS